MDHYIKWSRKWWWVNTLNSLVRQNWMSHCGTLPLLMPSRITTNTGFVSSFLGNFLTRLPPRLRVHEPSYILEHLQVNFKTIVETLFESQVPVPISCVKSTHLSGNCSLTCSALSPAFSAQQWRTPTPVFKKIRIVKIICFSNIWKQYIKTIYENN